VLRLALLQHLIRRVAGIVDGSDRRAQKGGNTEAERSDDYQRGDEVDGFLHGILLLLEINGRTLAWPESHRSPYALGAASAPTSLNRAHAIIPQA
jgi:hypothetical protein